MKTQSETWTRIVPRGEHRHARSGKTQVIDADACADICTNFLRGWCTPLPVEFDHIESLGVAGTITDLKNRRDGIWAKIDWNPEGKAAISGGEAARYKFLSPVLSVSPLDGERVRPFRLLSCGLTNKPAMRELLLSNSTFQTSLGWETDGELDCALELRIFLGLSANASDDQVKQAIERRKRGLTPPSHAQKLETIKRKHGLASRGSIRNRNLISNGNGDWQPDVTFQDLERLRKADQMAAQLSKHRTPRQIRRCADSFPQGALTRHLLNQKADELEQEQMEQRRKQPR